MKNKLFTPAILLLPLWFGLNSEPVENKKTDNATSALSIFLYSVSDGQDADKFNGETLIVPFAVKKALEIYDFSLSNVQNLYLNQGVGLGSNQKAEGNKIVFRTRASKAIPYLYRILTIGNHFDDMVFEVVTLPNGGDPIKIHDKIELKFVMVSSVQVESVDKTTGQAIFSVTIEYGAIKRTMTDYDQFGVALPPNVVNWSYVKNNNTFDI